MFWVVLIVFGGLVLYFVATYNSFVSLKTRIGASIQEIGNQLKRQLEFIPNLEETVKGYFKQEKDLYKMLTDARKFVSEAVSSRDLSKWSKASEKVAQLLPKLQIAVESNPQIRGADVASKLMDELRDTSDKVMYARRTLIDLTADYNIQVVAFPSNLVAIIFKFTPEKGLNTPVSGEHLEVSGDDIKPVKVKLG